VNDKKPLSLLGRKLHGAIKQNGIQHKKTGVAL